MDTWKTILSWEEELLPQETPAPQNHSCDMRGIIWNDSPEPADADGVIAWEGECAICHRHVEQRFYPTDDLYDVETGDEIR